MGEVRGLNMSGINTMDFVRGVEQASIIYSTVLKEYSVENERLENENAKMRELMRDTYDCICEMYAYMDGGYAYEDAEADPAYGPILKRMRELGVETEL
jgi:hypothetical protein